MRPFGFVGSARRHAESNVNQTKGKDDGRRAVPQKGGARTGQTG